MNKVGGGLVREIQVEADQSRLSGLNLDILDIANLLETANQDIPSSRLIMADTEIDGRTSGRFRPVDEIINLPVTVTTGEGEKRTLPLGEIAQIIDGTGDKRLEIRLNGLLPDDAIRIFHSDIPSAFLLSSIGLDIT